MGTFSTYILALPLAAFEWLSRMSRIVTDIIFQKHSMGILFFIEKQNKSGKALGEKRCSFVFHVFTENKILYIFFTSGGFHSDPSSKQCKDAIHSPQ